MADSNDSPQDFPLPPASFEFLIESVLMQTQMQLGLLHFGEKQEDAEPNLPLAKHSIDMLAMLQEKTRGNLTVEEQRLIENGLTELRFRYVQVADEQKRRNTAPSIIVPPSVSDKKDDRPLIITPDGGKGSKTE
ncbi:MAG TPA: DUF1844 domain-containing protein [Bryobacteraceae bacterium]|jgi:hypothetical protein|nr:DUF1844 domain-containing protein [Bryobacteraceae bacterium]